MRGARRTAYGAETNDRYLKSVDRHNQWTVSAFIATSGTSPVSVSLIFADVAVKFVLLHDQKNDDGIRQFFLDLWELYVKVSARSQLHSLVETERLGIVEPLPYGQYTTAITSLRCTSTSDRQADCIGKGMSPGMNHGPVEISECTILVMGSE
jgi:hypothetical protein